MGVSGAGKSTVGALLAARLGWRFLDADEFHPPENVARMRAGTPLTDEDRWPWLDRLNSMLKKETNAVLACSALKQAYRDLLTDGLPDCKIAFLRGDIDLIRSRMHQRQHKYMPASLLDSQFATLEPPANALCVDVSSDIESSVATIVAAVRG